MASSEDALQRIQDIDAFLSQDLCATLVNCTTNSFFSSQNEEACLAIAQDSGSFWSAVPSEWQNWILDQKVLDESGRDELLKRLANGAHDSSMPASLQNYLSSCAALSLQRDQSHSAMYASKSTQGQVYVPTAQRMKQLPRGQNPKKAGEVQDLVNHIPLLFASAPRHALDIGSGRAHLSHTLASPPLCMKVTAIDSSEVSLAGANKLRAGFQAEDIEHRCVDLDEASIASLLAQWPDASTQDSSSLVLTLHGCGDLTTNLLKAWLPTQQTHHTLLAVGCCYNMMDTKNNGLSFDSRQSTLSDLTARHLNLATQVPSAWNRSNETWSETNLSMLKLFYRARFEAELAISHPDQKTLRIKRLKDKAYSSYGVYREMAAARLSLDVPPSLPLCVHGFEGSQEKVERFMLFRLSIIWTIRALLGPLIEAQIVLERFVYLSENVQPGWTVKLVPVLQSLRCFALTVSQD